VAARFVNGVNPEEVNHPSGALRYDDVRSKPIVLSSEEREQYERRKAALDKLLAQRTGVKAKYKIEVRFAKARSTWKPTPGVVSWWESGSKLHGGGDEKVYFCPGRREKRNDCEKPIPEAGIGAGVVTCPACGKNWKAEVVIGELIYNLPMQHWATVILKHFVNLDHNADIVLKHSKDDLRSVAKQEESFRRSEKLDRTRAERAMYIYPLRNIIKDTSAGADLHGRILSFLTA
jgi:hypothetical protein